MTTLSSLGRIFPVAVVAILFFAIPQNSQAIDTPGYEDYLNCLSAALDAGDPLEAMLKCDDLFFGPQEKPEPQPEPEPTTTPAPTATPAPDAVDQIADVVVSVAPEVVAARDSLCDTLNELSDFLCGF